MEILIAFFIYWSTFTFSPSPYTLRPASDAPAAVQAGEARQVENVVNTDFAGI